MRKSLPIIHESAEQLKHQLHQETDERKRERLQALYFIQSGQATSRRARAILVGAHRHTIGDWLERHAAGGLPDLGTIGHSSGRPLSLPPAVLDALRARLQSPGVSAITSLLPCTYRTTPASGHILSRSSHYLCSRSMLYYDTEHTPTTP